LLHILGSLSEGTAKATPDLLFVGTQSNLLAYDVERNADSFFIDVQDGVNCLSVGKAGSSTTPLVVAGGNCSVLGFNATGAEAFWTVTGDNVSSLAISDIDASGKPSLLVGSDDFEIRVFKNEELVSETTEADKVMFLTHMKGSEFAYGLANGTVGVYNNPKVRAWRVKTKSKVTALHTYDLDLDGVKEVFSGWGNGNFNVRRADNGEVIFKESMDTAIASILTADYRMDGKEEVMICSESGEIKAYLATDVEFGTMFESGVGKTNAADQKMINDLQAQKIQLMNELKILERSLKPTRAGDIPVGALPANTTLSYSLEADPASSAVLLKVEATTDVQIVNLIAADLGMCFLRSFYMSGIFYLCSVCF
jgi:Bardet-Biedl syndrome 2 protein